MLSSMFIYPVRMQTVYTQYLTQLIGTQASQQTIGKFVSQRFPISIVNRSPMNALGDRDNAITSYSTILHSWHSALLASCASDGDHVPCDFILQSDWFLKILRGNSRHKMNGNATRPFSQFFGRGLGTRVVYSVLVNGMLLYHIC